MLRLFSHLLSRTCLLSFIFQLVLDSGRRVEFGSPKELLDKEGGYFKALVDESSDREELYVAAGAP